MVSPSSQPHGPGEGVKGASPGTFAGAEVDRNHGDPVSANYVNVYIYNYIYIFIIIIITYAI